MDLTFVKAAVKAWEKSFKAQHGRDPTKTDIKQDSSGIAEKYTLYRTLSKTGSSSQQASSSSQRQASSSSTSYNSRQSTGEPSHATPRIVPALQYPTTPTPPPRRTSGTTIHDHGEASRNLKRTASKAALAPSSPPLPSATRPSFITTKKSRPTDYSGPIYDHNPVNPFAVTPPKPSPSLVVQPGPSTSPFIHATSPRRLKEVLQLNSLRKVRERDGIGSPLKEITPRTRARKRLRGEVVAETPVKDRLPRGKRGKKRSEGKEAMMVEVQDVEEDEEEDELGPSPLKPLDGEKRTFTSLLVEADVHAQGRNEAKKKVRENEKRGRPSEMLGLFGKASKGKEKGRPGSSTRQPTPSTSTPPPRASDLSTDDVSDPPPIPSPAPIDEPATEAGSSEEMSTPPPDELLEAAAAQISLSRPSRPSKILSLSDDEEDEWDSEGGRKQRTVVIVPTRRPVRRRDSDDDPIHHEEAENGAEQDEEDNDEAVPVPPLVEGTTATSTTLPSSPTTTTLAPPLLSLLSLNSPSSRSKQSRLADLRVKAIFNPTDATRLRAIKRGQEIFVPGEGGEEGEEEKIMEAYEEGDAAGEGDQEGDVDWESENEGWKRTAIGMEDDDDGW